MEQRTLNALGWKQDLQLSEALLTDWYSWRWSQVFAVAQPVPLPTVPDDLERVLPIAPVGSVGVNEVLADHQACGGDLSSLAPYEVTRLRGMTAGSLRNPLNDSFGDQSVSIGDLVGALHRVRLKVEKQAARFEPLYGELPEGQYLSSIRTQFLLAHEPTAQPHRIAEFYVTACRTLNRLLLAKGSKLQSAMSSASRILTAVESLDEVMGLLTTDSHTYLTLDRRCGAQRLGVSIEEIQKQVNLRIAYRTARDWAQADAIQTQLNDSGITIIDGEGVTDWWIPYSV